MWLIKNLISVCSIAFNRQTFVHCKGCMGPAGPFELGRTEHRANIVHCHGSVTIHCDTVTLTPDAPSLT